MDSHPGTAIEKSPEPIVHGAALGSRPAGVAPATTFLLAAWIGLVAGLLDLGLMVCQSADRRGLLSPGRRLRLDHPGGRRGRGVVAGNDARALRLAASADRPPGHCRGAALLRWIPRPAARGCPWSCGPRSCCPAGSPSSPPGWSVPESRAFLKVVRRTAPLLIGIVLAAMLGTIGGPGLVGASGRGHVAAATLRAPRTCC